MKKEITAVLTTLLLLTACGQSGPLYLPEKLENQPTKTTQTVVPMGVTGQNQSILSEQPYTNNSASYKVPKEAN